MLIVAVGLLASGKISTRRPFARSYSVIPSTVATLVTPCGNWAASGVPAIASAAATAAQPRKTNAVFMGPRRTRDVSEQLSKLVGGRIVLKAGKTDPERLLSDANESSASSWTA